MVIDGQFYLPAGSCSIEKPSGVRSESPSTFNRLSLFKKISMRILPAFIVLCICLGVAGPGIAGPQGGETAVSRPALVNLARDFVARMNKSRVDAAAENNPESAIALRGLEDGEGLLFRAVLPGRLMLSGVLVGEVRDGQVILSFRDLVDVLEFPIDIDPETSRATGWYIRENKRFELDTISRTVSADGREFAMSEAVAVNGPDILVPAAELGQWFGLELELDLANLEIQINSPQPLPVQERLARRKFGGGDLVASLPVLPRGNDARQAIDIPFVDVSTTSTYRKNGDGGDTLSRHNANIRTAGDFAYGTLTTQSQLNNDDQLASVRVNYKRESLQPDLLGPLKARRYEIGDVLPTTLPLAEGVAQELGARITNIDPLLTYSRSTTQITGSLPPGWDVELYRGAQLLDLITVGDSGVYLFNDVELFRSQNNFRLVMYGPQGEIREENVYIPVDPSRQAEESAVYDVSLTMDSKQTYRAETGFKNPDEGAPRLTAFYQVPFGDSSAVYAGLRAGQQNEEQKTYAHSGVSTTALGTLLNADTAIDEEGEMAAQLVARRDFGEHQLRNTISWATDEFQGGAFGAQQRVFGETFNLNGPLSLPIGLRPRYNIALDYGIDSNDQASLTTTAGFNTAWRRISLNQNYVYTNRDTAEDDILDSVTTVAASLGKNRLRLASDYQILPERELQRISATLLHRFNRDLNVELGVQKRIPQSLTEGTAQLNWQAGFARISPSVTYNSEGDASAMLNTNFGLAYEPQGRNVRMFDQTITSNGALSAFVFLDKDGDQIFNGEDEPISNATILSAQNGGRAVTNEKGIAFISNLQELRLTDVSLVPESLKDPFWIPGFDGASILPREGFVAELEFPVHIAGELDGFLYSRQGSGTPHAAGGLGVALYGINGMVRMAQAEADGFFLFSLVPPGEYWLIVDGRDAAQNKLIPPPPEKITIGYDGTLIYGKKIFLDEATQNPGAVMVSILGDLEDYLADNPVAAGRIMRNGAPVQAVINLGSSHSRLLNNVLWLKAKTRFRALLKGAEFLVPPSESKPDSKSGLHELRMVLPEATLGRSYAVCRTLAIRGAFCTVEIIPVLPVENGKLAQASAGTKSSQMVMAEK